MNCNLALVLATNTSAVSSANPFVCSNIAIALLRYSDRESGRLASIDAGALSLVLSFLPKAIASMKPFFNRLVLSAHRHQC